MVWNWRDNDQWWCARVWRLFYIWHRDDQTAVMINVTLYLANVATDEQKKIYMRFRQNA